MDHLDYQFPEVPADDAAVLVNVTETGHSKSIGDPVYPNTTGGWDTAIAIKGSTALGVVTDVVDANTFVVQRTSGPFNWPGHGLDATKLHYLDKFVLGGTSDNPANLDVRQLLFDVIDANTVYYYCWPAARHYPIPVT